MKRENVINAKSFQFALIIIDLVKEIQSSKKEFVLTKQILRSGTAIGAMVREAENTESKKDFIHKMSIGLKEANETDYWLELLYQSEYILKPRYDFLKDGITQLIRILVSIVKSAKSNS